MVDPDLFEDTPACDSGVVQATRYDLSGRLELEGLTVSSFSNHYEEGFLQAMSKEFQVKEQHIKVRSVTSAWLRRRLLVSAAGSNVSHHASKPPAVPAASRAPSDAIKIEFELVDVSNSRLYSNTLVH